MFGDTGGSGTPPEGKESEVLRPLTEARALREVKGALPSPPGTRPAGGPLPVCGLGCHARCGARRAIDGPAGTGQAIERRLGGGDAGRNEPQPQGPPPGPLRAPKTFGRVAAGPPASEQQGAVATFRAAGPPGARVGLAGKVALIPAHLALPDPPPAEAPPALGPEPPAQRVPSHGAPDGGAGRGPGRGPRRGTGPRWGGEAMQGLPRPQAARVSGWRRRLTRKDVGGVVL